MVERVQRQDLEREEEELRHHRNRFAQEVLGSWLAGELGMGPEVSRPGQARHRAHDLFRTTGGLEGRRNDEGDRWQDRRLERERPRYQARAERRDQAVQERRDRRRLEPRRPQRRR